MRERVRLAGAACVLACLFAGCSLVVPQARQAPQANNPPSMSAPGPSVSATQPPVPDVVVENASNFRDVAGSGEGLVLSDGARMARGVVYRSGRLRDLSESDKDALVGIGLSDIFDLRTDEVAERSPDPEIEGVDYHHVNLFAVYSKRTPAFSNTDEARAEREDVNRAFVDVADQRARTAEVLRGIAAATGPVVVHCTEGKDRTGWIAALLQLIAGADEEGVIREYLLSNDYRRDLIETEVDKVQRTKGALSAKIARLQLEVDGAYLTAGLDEVAADYDDLQGFLTQGLGLDQATIDALRAKLRRG